MNRLLALVSTALVFEPLHAAVSEPPTGTFDAPYVSKYVWRGINIVNASVMQPSLTFDSKGYTFQVWANVELTDENFYPGFGLGKGKLTELDLTFQYNWNCGNLALSAGLIHYRFPNTGFASTTEVVLSAGFDGFLAPTLTVYQDVDQSDGTYANFSISHSLNTGVKVGQENAQIEFSTGIGYGSKKNNQFYYGVGKNAAADWTLSASVPIAFKGWTLTPGVFYSHLIDDAIGTSATRRSNVWFSLGASIGF